jgi:hypothetical protein
LPEPGRHWKRRRTFALGKHAGDLQRVERIAGGDLVQPDEHRSPERASELLVQYATERAHGQAREPNVDDELRREAVESESIGLVRPLCENDADPLVAQAPKRVRERRRRLRVDPLCVVDRDQHVRALGEQSKRREERDRDRSRIDRMRGRVFAKKRDGKRSTLRFRQS